MKRTLLILMAILLAMTIVSCKGNKEAAKLPDDEIKAQVAT